MTFELGNHSSPYFMTKLTLKERNDFPKIS